MWFDLEYGAHRALETYTSLHPNEEMRHFTWHPFDARPELAETNVEGIIFRRGEQVVGKIEVFRTLAQKYTEVLQHPQWDCIIVDTLKELWTYAHKGYLQEVQTVDPNRVNLIEIEYCLLYTSPSPRDRTRSRMPSSA